MLMADKLAPATVARPQSAARSGGPTHADLARLTALGVLPGSVAGRLRLVLLIGCYRDFRFTREILLTSAARAQVDAAIEELQKLGAACDCGVLGALGQPARGVLWHNPATAGRAIERAPASDIAVR
jgi:hypothetical protein